MSDLGRLMLRIISLSLALGLVTSRPVKAGLVVSYSTSGTVESPNGASMAPDGFWARAGGLGALARSVSSIYGREAVIVPAIVIGLVVFGVFLRGRCPQPLGMESGLGCLRRA